MDKKIIWLLALVTALFSSLISAAQHQVSPGQGLQQVIDDAASGDTIIVNAGEYHGNFIINKTLTLKGQSLDGLPTAIINANGQGDGIRVSAPHVTIDGLSVINWGDNLTAQNSAIYIEQQASHPVIKNNRLKGRGMGIYVEKSHHGLILNNKVQGDESMRPADRGNGIHLVMVKYVEVRNNEVWHTRDGLYIISSNNNKLIDNHVHDLRFGVHYMYSYHNQVSKNLAENTRVGYALMQSKFLTITENQSISSSDHGLLMNFITQSTIKNNYISRVVQQRDIGVAGTEGKALFVYNSLFNTITDNWFSDSQIGVHLTAGSEDNKIFNNSFVNNPTQVKYVSSRDQDWNGNFWSNYLGWDSNNDGKGDTTFEPNDSVDKMLWQYPEAKLLMNSPAVLTLRWVQREFPVLKPLGVRDHQPLMKSPFQATPQQLATLQRLENKS